jgi:flagellar motor protein MotB
MTLFFGGCAMNSPIVKGKMEKMHQQQLALARQNQELVARAAKLSQDNEEQQMLLAQAEQQMLAAQQKANLLQGQVNDMTSQVTQLQDELAQKTQTAQALLTSQKERSTVSITPNNSYLEQLPVLDIEDVYVRRDQDCIRIEIPDHKLFQPNTYLLKPEGRSVLSRAVNEIKLNYPDQLIGVEGHTDDLAVQYQNPSKQHEVSVQKAMVVHQYLVNQIGMDPEQMFLVGHGANRVVMPNVTEAGRKRNRRVELVIYATKKPGVS